MQPWGRMLLLLLCHYGSGCTGLYTVWHFQLCTSIIFDSSVMFKDNTNVFASIVSLTLNGADHFPILWTFLFLNVFFSPSKCTGFNTFSCTIKNQLVNTSTYALNCTSSLYYVLPILNYYFGNAVVTANLFKEQINYVTYKDK